MSFYMTKDDGKYIGVEPEREVSSPYRNSGFNRKVLRCMAGGDETFSDEVLHCAQDISENTRRLYPMQSNCIHINVNNDKGRKPGENASKEKQ